jgi:hypothetical protein
MLKLRVISALRYVVEFINFVFGYCPLNPLCRPQDSAPWCKAQYLVYYLIEWRAWEGTYAHFFNEPSQTTVRVLVFHSQISYLGAVKEIMNVTGVKIQMLDYTDIPLSLCHPTN